MSTEYKQATDEDVDRLLDLYLKTLCKSGIVSACEDEHRDHFRGEVRKVCASDEIWFLDDAQGPISLGHYDPNRDEIVAIGTRDGMERKGHADRMFKWLADRHPTAATQPTTRGGKAIAKKNGFSQKSRWDARWVKTPSQ